MKDQRPEERSYASSEQNGWRLERRLGLAGSIASIIALATMVLVVVLKAVYGPDTYSPALEIIAVAAVLVCLGAVLLLRRIAKSGSSLPWPTSLWAFLLNRPSANRIVLHADLPRVRIVCDRSSKDLCDTISARLQEADIDATPVPLSTEVGEDVFSRKLAKAGGVYFIYTDVTEKYIAGFRAWADAHSATPVLLVADDAHMHRARLVPDFTVVPATQASSELWLLFVQATSRGALWIKLSQSYHRFAAVLGMLVIILAALSSWQWQRISQTDYIRIRDRYDAVKHASFAPAFSKVAELIRDSTVTNEEFGISVGSFLEVTRQDCIHHLGLSGDVSVSLWRPIDGDSACKFATTRPSERISLPDYAYISTAILDTCFLIYSKFAGVGDSVAWKMKGKSIGALKSKQHGEVEIGIGDNTHTCKLVDVAGERPPDEMICVGAGGVMGISLTAYDVARPSLNDEAFGVLRRALAVLSQAYVLNRATSAR